MRIRRQISKLGAAFRINILYLNPRRKGILGCLLQYSQILIPWFIKLSVQTCQPLIVIYRKDILIIIIGNLHQFVGHCPIHLDPRVKPVASTWLSQGKLGGLELERGVLHEGCISLLWVWKFKKSVMFLAWHPPWLYLTGVSRGFRPLSRVV